MTRRAVLQAAAGGLAGATLLGGGCTRSGRVEVAVVWSGTELERFRRVVHAYDRPVDVTSVGDDIIDAFLRARHRAGRLPDVAILRPGLVRDYAQAGWLTDLTHLKTRITPTLRDFLDLDGTGKLQGVWLKVAHKSSFWYLTSSVRGESPTTWSELLNRVRELAERDGHAPLALGAADGWVLTDWFENLLAAHISQAWYESLSRGSLAGGSVWNHPDVEQALHDLADIWSIPSAFPGGGQRAQLTQFDQSVLQVTTGEAEMLHAEDFPVGSSSELLPARFDFPSPTDQEPLVVGGDAAVVFEDSPTGRELVDWLTDPDQDPFRSWREAGGYLSPFRDIEPDSHPREGFFDDLAREIRSPEAENLRFDLSELLPGELTGADGLGLWQVLQDFFANVAVVADPEVDAAVDTAIGSLQEIGRRVAEESGG